MQNDNSTLAQDIARTIGAEKLVAPADVAGRQLSPAGLTAPATWMIRPKTTDDVGKAMQLCHEAGQPVVVVGGATGLAGGLTMTGNEWLLSLESMRGIEIDTGNRVAVVEAGAILQDVQDKAAAAGLSFPIDLGARGSATVGGMIATNAGGEKAFRFGMMREQVLGLEVVKANGERLDLMNRMIKNNTGYDLKQLFIGAEGTLGIVTRAVLKLRPHLPVRNTGMAAVADYDAAVRLKSAVEEALGNELTAYEIMWPSLYEVVTRNRAGALPLPLGAGMYVLFEAESGAGRTTDMFVSSMEPLIEAGMVDDLVLAQSDTERNAMWAIRNNVPAMIAAFMPPVPYDISVPTAEMGRFVETVESDLLARWPEGRMTAFGHMGDNNVHLVVTLGADTAAGKDSLNHMIYDHVGRLGGSISAEHGLGADKRAYLGYCRTPEAIAAMRQLKELFDPKGLLNPGKVLPAA